MSHKRLLSELADNAIALSKHADEARLRANEALNEWAAAACPFKVGDQHEIPRAAYTNVGKQCIIRLVRGRLDVYGEPNWVVYATVLRKDGSPCADSVKSATWEQWSWEQDCKRGKGKTR